jgi:ketosteroid isomerase-like protein
MTEHAGTSLHDLVIRTFATLQAKDLEMLMHTFAEDAVVIDPHFPTPRMQGNATIKKGFREAMSGMRSFGYTIVNYFESENGQGAAVETATHHVLKQDGKRCAYQLHQWDSYCGTIDLRKRVAQSQLAIGLNKRLLRNELW